MAHLFSIFSNFFDSSDAHPADDLAASGELVPGEGTALMDGGIKTVATRTSLGHCRSGHPGGFGVRETVL